ncbi:MAG: acyl-CoA dehydrogenase family protein [Myxococcota bacterium]
MDFEFSEEQRRFQAEVEKFLEERRSPEVMDRNPEQLSQTVDTPPKRALMRELAERGWLGMSWPAEYGGRELPGSYDFLLTEALAREGAPQPGKGVGIVGRTIIRHGNDGLKRLFLPRIIRGEIEFAIGYSEPEAGSDAAAMALKAVRDDERRGWVLNGRKVWTTSAHFADWYWVGARTDQESKHRGITLFLVEMDHPGLTVQPTWTIGDERTNEVFFDDVFVSDDFVVGRVNEGWTYICEALDLERFAMMPIGPVERKIETLRDYLASSERDGVLLRDDPCVRRALARLVTDLEVARMLQRQVVALAVKGGVPTVESSMYKLFMTELGQRVADTALDMMGPCAQLKAGEPDAPVNGRFERSYRYTVVDTIGGGSSEIQKNIIARRGLGLPRNF